MKQPPPHGPPREQGRMEEWFGVGRPWGPTRDQLRNRQRAFLGIVGLFLLVGGTIGGVLLWQVTRPSNYDIRSQADQAYADGEYERARDLYLEIAGKVHAVYYPDIVHSLALCYEQLGDQEQLRARMTELAGLGDSRGHIWLAKQLLAKRHLQPTELSLAQRHLEAALEDDPSSAYARRQLIRLYLAGNNVRKAIPMLDSLVADDQADKLDLALALLSVKRNDQAMTTAREALDELSAKLAKTPGDLKLRLRTADTAVMLGDFARAEQLLLEGQKYIGEQKRLADALSRLYGAWGTRERKADEATSLELLIKSTRIKPVSPATYSALRDFCASSKTQSAAARSQLQQALIRNDAPPALIHSLLADLAMSKSDLSEAQRHWELAAADNTRSTTAINNLALSQLQETPPNLILALSLIDRAISTTPNVPQVHATRGRILLRMGRWAEARDELNAVLRALEKNPAVQLDLAEACLRTGFPDRARGNLDAVLKLDPAMQLDVARCIVRCGAAKDFGSYLDAAAKYYQQQSAQDPQQIPLRISWAEALMLAGKFPEAEQVLTAGRQASDDPSLTTALASLYVAWPSQPGQPATIDRVLQALALDPKHRMALIRLVDLGESDNPAREQAQAEVDKLLASEQPPADLLAVLGTRRLLAKNYAKARTYLEPAFKTAPDTPGLRNNLAWALIHSEPVEADRALELIDAALVTNPSHPSYRGTRAHILASLGRWEDAKADLDYALKFGGGSEENRELQQEIDRHLQSSPPQQTTAQKP